MREDVQQAEVLQVRVSQLRPEVWHFLFTLGTAVRPHPWATAKLLSSISHFLVVFKGVVHVRM